MNGAPILATVTPTGLKFEPGCKERVLRLEGQRVEVRPVKRTRSLDQNAWIWGIAYPLIAETIGYDRDEIDEMHYALVARCFGTHADIKLGVEVPNARSSTLTTKEFSDYMEWLVRFAAKEFNCVIPLPDETPA